MSIMLPYINVLVKEIIRWDSIRLFTSDNYLYTHKREAVTKEDIEFCDLYKTKDFEE